MITGHANRSESSKAGSSLAHIAKHELQTGNARAAADKGNITVNEAPQSISFSFLSATDSRDYPGRFYCCLQYSIIE